MKSRLEQHFEMMVANEITFTVGISDFYKGNGGKDKVWKHLGLKSNWTWAKRLEFLFPGKFTVRENKLYSTIEHDHNKQPKIAEKKTKKSKMNERARSQDLGTHIETWIERVEHFNGTAKKRSTPSSVKKNAPGKACPTCQQQMVDKKSNPHKISAEHIIPLSLGGDNTVSGSFPQVVAMCHACNTARNQLVLAVKDSNRAPMVEFLIRHVYDSKIANLNAEYFSIFKKFYFSITGMEIRLKAARNELLILGGFISNHPSSLMNIAMEHLKDIPRKIVLFIEQKDSNRINLDLWSRFADEIRLVPNGKENVQCSVIVESSKYEQNSVVCLMEPAQSKGIFETLLGQNQIKLLDASVIIRKPVTHSKFRLSKFLPWNWFARNPKQAKLEPQVEEGLRIKHEIAGYKINNVATHPPDAEPKSPPPTKDESERLLSNDNGEIHPSSQLESYVHQPLEWATVEQLKIITDIRDNLVSAISQANLQGREFRVNGMAPIYYSYGGSAAVKDLLGLPKNTKMKDMFWKLYGDTFVFSGEAPLWVVNTSLQPRKNDHGENERNNEKRSIIDQYLEEQKLEQGVHSVEVLRNVMIGMVHQAGNRHTTEDIKEISHSIKTHFGFSWNKFFSEFDLEYPLGGTEAWAQNFSKMFEMSGVEYDTEIDDNGTTYVISTKIEPLPTIESTTIPPRILELAYADPSTWADSEQLRIILEMGEYLKSRITELNQNGEVFQAKHLQELYKPYGGSLALKAKLGFTRVTKLKDMFFKLFGTEFTFTGETTEWTLSHSPDENEQTSDE